MSKERLHLQKHISVATQLSEDLFTGIPREVKGVTCPPKILYKCAFTRNPEKTLITFEGLCLSPQKNSCKRLWTCLKIHTKQWV